MTGSLVPTDLHAPSFKSAENVDTLLNVGQFLASVDGNSSLSGTPSIEQKGNSSIEEGSLKSFGHVDIQIGKENHLNMGMR